MSPLLTSAAAWLFAAASVALWAAIRTAARSGPGQAPATVPAGAARARRVCVVRPCAGLEPELRDTLASRMLDDGAIELVVRFAVASEDDAAWPAAAAAAAQLTAAGADARVVVTHARGPNRKAAQLAAVLSSEAVDYVIVADSDVDLGATSAEALLSPFCDTDVAAAWAPPVEVTPCTAADRASGSVLDASMHAFALLGALDSGGMVGKLVALRADDLTRVGGFGELVSFLGEDVELARRLRSLGRRVVRLDTPARSRARGRSPADVTARFARWVAVVRAQRPWLLLTYPLVLAPAPCLVALTLVAAPSDGWRALALTALTVVYRILVASLARRRSGSPRGQRGLAVASVASDLVIWAAFARALASRRVMWRGTSLRLQTGGPLLAGESK